MILENCCKPNNSRLHECNNDCWQFCISYTHNINNALYLIRYYCIVEGHVLLHGNIVVVVVAFVIKHETFSSLGDNHIIIIIYIYIVITLLLLKTRTHHTHIITVLHYDTASTESRQYSAHSITEPEYCHKLTNSSDNWDFIFFYHYIFQSLLTYYKRLRQERAIYNQVYFICTFCR